MPATNSKKILIAVSIVCILLTVSLSGAIVSLSTTNSTIKNQNGVINNLRGQLSVETNQSISTISALNSKIANLTLEITALKPLIPEPGSHNPDDAAAIANLQSQLASANSQINTLNSRVATLQSQVTNLMAEINANQPNRPTLVFHVCEKGEGYDWGHLPDANATYNQILAVNPNNKVLLLPEYQGSANWTAELSWITANFGGKQGIPIMLDVFGGGNGSTPTPMLSTAQISSAMAASNIQYLRFSEVISWHMDHPELPFPADYITAVLEFCRANNLKLFWTEWKVETFPTLQTYIVGYEDIVTVSFSTNSGYTEPSEGFMQLSQTFPHWGGSVQAWYWETRNASLMDMPASLLAEHALFAKSSGAEVIEFEPYWYFFDNGQATMNLRSLGSVLNY